MEYQSFYGGRRGTPFVLKAVYGSVKDLVEDFELTINPSTKGVSYGEYAIVNTEDKSDETNGMIYQRLFSGEALYVGQIVGPAGQNPKIVFFDYDKQKDYNKTYYKQKFYGNSGEYTDTVYTKVIKPEPSDTNGKYIVKYFSDEAQTTELTVKYYTINTTTGEEEEIKDDIANAEIIHLADNSYFQTETANDTNAFQLVPGKDTNGYNDAIKYSVQNFRDTNGNTQGCLVGFKIPYLVNEFIAESISAYLSPTVTAVIDENDDENHPFYNQWKLGIPKGKKGDSVVSISPLTGYFPLGTSVYEKNENVFQKSIDNNQNEITLNEDVYLDTSRLTKIEHEYYEYISSKYVKISDIKPNNNNGNGVQIEYMKFDSSANGISEFKNIGGKSIWCTCYDSESGTMTVYYMDGTKHSITLHYPTDFQIQNHTQDFNWAGNQCLQLSYGTDTSISIGEPLNCVLDMKVVTNTNNFSGDGGVDVGDLLVLYSDPERRQTGYVNNISDDDWNGYIYQKLGKVYDKDINIGIEIVTEKPSSIVKGMVYYYDSNDNSDKGLYIGTSNIQWTKMPINFTNFNYTYLDNNTINSVKFTTNTINFAE